MLGRARQGFFFRLQGPPYASYGSSRFFGVMARNQMKDRVSIWNKLKAASESGGSPAAPLQFLMPDGSTIEREAGTKPISIAKDVIGQRSKNFTVATIHGEDVGLASRLEHGGALVFHAYESSDTGRRAFWRTAASVVSQAVYNAFSKDDGSMFGRDVEASSFQGIEFAVSDKDNSFYVDYFMDGRVIHPDEYSLINEEVRRIIKRNDPIEILRVPREDALSLFHGLDLKQERVRSLGEHVDLFKCGDYVDVTDGPLMPSVSALKSLKIFAHSGVYFDGDSERPLLQRVYAVSFPSKGMMATWEEEREAAEKRDHRNIGKHQELFMFNEHSPGSPFFLPHGARIYNRLVDYLKGQYKVRGYEEVMSPILYNNDLWKTSGHWDHYKDDMFIFDIHSHSCDTKSDNSEAKSEFFGIKPMNCPGHCLIFKERSRSYRELPLRLADFSPLHRNELTGALSGLTRVRRFCQDDAHIFCTEEQMSTEIHDCLEFVSKAYERLGFQEVTMKLSTRPEDFAGELNQWNKAEDYLQHALDSIGRKWILNKGDGAFYGPKIDVTVTDALQRQHQCATIQLDFVLPKKFELEYAGSDGGLHTPVLIHRAILGSVERMIAVLAEHTSGKWPLWLSPRQVMIIPVNESTNTYADTIRRNINADSGNESWIFADIDNSASTLQKRIRAAQLLQYNYILVVGNREVESGNLTVRTRAGEIMEDVPVPAFVRHLRDVTLHPDKETDPVIHWS